MSADTDFHKLKHGAENKTHADFYPWFTVDLCPEFVQWPDQLWSKLGYCSLPVLIGVRFLS